MEDKTPAANSGLAKVAVTYFYESLVSKRKVVFLINFCDENRHLRQATYVVSN
jgi:hypothetical protein